jgi:hypothetical protein
MWEMFWIPHHKGGTISWIQKALFANAIVALPCMMTLVVSSASHTTIQNALASISLSNPLIPPSLP